MLNKFKVRPVITVCLAGLCAAASALPPQEPDTASTVPPQIQSTSAPFSDFEVRISGGEFLVRQKGTSEWKRSSTLNETIAVGLLDGTQKVYLGTKTIKPPKPRRMEPPEYPDSERRSHIGSHVSLHLVVDDRGAVRFPTVDVSPGPEFTNAVIEAVRKWSFEPAKLNGQSVAVLINVTTEFY